MPKIHVMVDLETMSTQPNAAIVSIGAVKFSQFAVQEPFYRIVNSASNKAAGLDVDPDTMAWWAKQSPEARKVLEPGGMDLRSALADFTEWLGGPVLLWGNGADFDNVILRSAYRAVSLKPPFQYWDHRCYRTVKALNPAVKMDRSGTHHNALDDARSQAEHLIRIGGF